MTTGGNFTILDQNQGETTTGLDFSLYSSPGVYTDPVAGPLIAAFRIAGSVGMFGQARGYRVMTESIAIPPDGGGTVSTLSAPAISGATNIYTVASYTNNTVLAIDTGNVAESRTVTNVSAINTTLSSSTTVGNSTIQCPVPIGVGSTVVIDTAPNTETRTVTGVSGAVTGLATSATSGTTTLYTNAPVPSAVNIVIDTGGSVENRAVTGLSSGGATTLSGGTTAVGATTITTLDSIPSGAVLTIDSGGNLETRTTTAVSGSGPYTVTLPALTHIHAANTPITYPVSTTLSASSLINATTINTAASIPIGTSITVDTAGSADTVTTVGVSGAGPFTISVPALAHAHSSGVAVTFNAATSIASSSTSAGATTFTTPNSIPSGSTITIDSGAAAETRVTSAVSGTGPYIITVPAFTNSHAASVNIVYGVSTTLAGSTLVNATSITTVAPVAVGTFVIIDSASVQETRTVSAVSGSGPYTLTVPALTNAHSSGAAVVAPYALTVAALTYAHVQGALIVAPNTGPYTMQMTALAYAHPSATVVSAPASLAVSALTYGHFLGAATIGSGTVPIATVPFSQTGIDESSLTVRDPVTGNIYRLNTDYRIQDILGISGDTHAPDTYTTVVRVTSGTIPASKQVQVNYHYTDPTYFEANEFFDYNSVVDQYGPALDVNGNIVSELTMGIGFALVNGARRVVAAACTNPGNVVVQDYQNALDQLKSDPSISIVVPCTGQQYVQYITKTHVDMESAARAERRGIVGRDGSATPVPPSTLESDAQNLYDSRMAMVAPSTVAWYNPNLNTVQTIGGHYMACALAGLAVSQNPALPLTRKSINGFYAITEKISDTEKDIETQAGLMVLEHSTQGNIRVRHGVTTNFTDLISREWTILGQQDAMVQQLRAYLDNDQLIGQIIDDLTLLNVRASTANALQSLINNNTILGYQNLAVRQLQTNPDVIEVSFEWRPAMPLNYIVCRFSVNISTGLTAVAGSLNSGTDTSISGPV